MKNPIQKYTADITDDQIDRLAKLEALSKFREAITQDKESVEEILNEIIEQREEEATAVGISLTPIAEGAAQILTRYDSLFEQAKKAQLELIKSA